MHQQIDDELSLFSNGYHKCMFVDSWIKYICPIVLTIECVIGNKTWRCKAISSKMYFCGVCPLILTEPHTNQIQGLWLESFRLTHAYHDLIHRWTRTIGLCHLHCQLFLLQRL